MGYIPIEVLCWNIPKNGKYSKEKGKYSNIDGIVWEVGIYVHVF
jgi:hypothetical protein